MTEDMWPVYLVPLPQPHVLYRVLSSMTDQYKPSYTSLWWLFRKYFRSICTIQVHCTVDKISEQLLLAIICAF